MRINSCRLPIASCQIKKAILLIVSYALVIAVVTGCAKREIKNIDSKGKYIICFGDSITKGHGVKQGEDYPSLLAKMTGLPVINAGIDSDTSEEALRRLDLDVLERDPLLVIIELGGNDFLRKIPLDVTVKNIKEIVDKVQAKGAMAAIVDISAGIIMGEYRDAYYKIAQEKGAIFIPGMFSGIITNPDLKSDMMHPNAIGYKIIAHRFYRAIFTYLNQNTLIKRYRK